MERIKNGKRIQTVFDVILGIATLILAMIFCATLDWPVNALVGIIVTAGTTLMIIQHRKSYVIDTDLLDREN